MARTAADRWDGNLQRDLFLGRRARAPKRNGLGSTEKFREQQDNERSEYVSALLRSVEDAQSSLEGAEWGASERGWTKRCERSTTSSYAQGACTFLLKDQTRAARELKPRPAAAAPGTGSLEPSRGGAIRRNDELERPNDAQLSSFARSRRLRLGHGYIHSRCSTRSRSDRRRLKRHLGSDRSEGS